VALSTLSNLEHGFIFQFDDQWQSSWKRFRPRLDSLRREFNNNRYDFTIVSDYQCDNWKVMWKAKLAQSKIDIIVFSDTYRANFTEALLFEGQELLKKHRNKLNLLIYDPDKPGIGPTVISYILREGETTGIYSMGEFRNWETLQIVTGIVSARFVRGFYQITSLRFSEYLYAAYLTADDNRRLTHTFEGDPKEDHQACWELVPLFHTKESYLILNFKSEYLYAAFHHDGSNRRQVYSWMNSGRGDDDEQAHWIIRRVEKDNKYVIINAKFKNEYLYATYHTTGPRRFVHTWMGGGEAVNDRQAI